MADVAHACGPSVLSGWLLDAWTSDRSARNITQALRLHGSLNLNALRKSVEFVGARYQAIWNISGETGGGSGDILPIQDFSGLPIDIRESEARRYIHRQADRSLDPKGGPLLQATLARLSASESILLISMHRSLSGAGILINMVTAELSALYNDHLAADPSESAGVFRLPPDRPQFSPSGALFGRESHLLPEALLARVREFSGAENVAPFTTLFAAFAALLSRHAAQRQFFVGAPLNNLESDAQRMPSGFAALLACQADLSGDPSFRELAQRARRSSLNAALQAGRPGVPLGSRFQVALIWEQAAWEAVRFSGLGVSAYELEARSTGLELVLHLEEQPAGLLMTADYDAVLFDPGTIRRFLGHYESLLASAISDPEESIWRLPILSQPERRQLVDEWNSATAQEYPRDVSLQQVIEAQVEKTPDAVAVAFAAASNNERLTYKELNDRANQLAAHLRSLGVTRNTLVGVCLERSIDLLIAPLAIFKAGAAYLPLDPDHPDDRIAPMVENARLQILIGRPELAARLPEFRGELVLLDWEVLRRYPSSNHPVAGSGGDLAYVIYTSGSTGQPKGVMISRRALNNLLWSVRDWFQFGPRDVLLALTTIAFDIAGVDVWLPLLAGGRMLMVERETAMDAELLQDAIQREGVTFLQGTPAIWKRLIDSGWPGNAGLQAVCTGEAMPKDLPRKLFPKVGGLWNMYGPTETTIWSTGYRFRGPDDPVLIGRPVANTQIYILDEHLAPTPIGVPGELYIGGDGLADGYLHKPELTAERFVADPFSERPGARLYKTGDLARYLSDGNIECLGRNDHQIKLRGYRIEPEEIQAAIAKHPSVRDAIAVLESSATGDSRIVAYLISRTEHPPDATELRNFLRQRLPDYMIPASFAFLDSFPLNGNGKIDRRALAQAKIQSPGMAGTGEPADQIEARLRDVFRSVLNLSAIGVDDDFFDLGGHSLTAAQLFKEINLRFNVQLPLATLFHAPTVRRIAELIRDAGAEQMKSPIVEIQPNGSRPPLYCIGAAGGEVIVFRRLAQELGQDQPIYGLQPFRLLASCSTVQQLAAAYIDELRMTGTPRPFCLLGYSFGGLVAVEMARQMQRNGIAPSAVVLIDSAYPAGSRQNERWSQKLQRYRFHWERVTNGGGLSHLLKRARYGVARLSHRASSTVGVSLPNGAKDVSEVQGLASESYRIKGYHGRVHLFRAESQLEFLTGGADLGWSGVLSELVVEEVPGDHGTINTGANLKILARKLRECLPAPLANGRSPRA